MERRMSHEDLHTQIAYLESVLAKSKTLAEILEKTPDLHLPNWYVGAGAIAQTVWNELHGYSLDHGLKDCDLVYFDEDRSSETQNVYRQRGSELFASLPVEVEITNEARVHLWYKEKFGKKITPYLSTEDAITTWPTTATSVGVRYRNGLFQVYAPYGLYDLLSMIVRPNKTLVSRDVYEKKTRRWKSEWPMLEVIAWDEMPH
ncbi:MAG TPA: nucleotidyltransferase family protein [Ktedonobacteraceae bacterium]